MENSIVLFVLGDLIVYERKSSPFELFGMNSYYWQRMGSEVAYGPFQTVLQATRNYEEWLKTTAGKAQPAAPAHLIIQPDRTLVKVDFRTKKRILT